MVSMSGESTPKTMFTTDPLAKLESGTKLMVCYIWLLSPDPMVSTSGVAMLNTTSIPLK